jgi:hypothetical protein
MSVAIQLPTGSDLRASIAAAIPAVATPIEADLSPLQYLVHSNPVRAFDTGADLFLDNATFAALGVLTGDAIVAAGCFDNAGKAFEKQREKALGDPAQFAAAAVDLQACAALSTLDRMIFARSLLDVALSAMSE